MERPFPTSHSLEVKYPSVNLKGRAEDPLQALVLELARDWGSGSGLVPLGPGVPLGSVAWDNRRPLLVQLALVVQH